MRLSRLRARSRAALYAFGGTAKILDRLLEVKLHPGKDEVGTNKKAMGRNLS